MDFGCPNCHKYKFSIWSVAFLGFRRVDVIFCPGCGAAAELTGRSATLINLITVIPSIASVFILENVTKFDSSWEFIVILSVLAIFFSLRCFAAARFAVLIKHDFKDQTDTRIVASLNEIRDELVRLKDEKRTQFTVIFEPKNDGYMSLYDRRGIFVIELAFATETLEKFGDRFKHAASINGATVDKFDTHGMKGYEVKLGEDVDVAADKARRIFSSVFDVSADSKILVDRN